MNEISQSDNQQSSKGQDPNLVMVSLDTTQAKMAVIKKYEEEAKQLKYAKYCTSSLEIMLTAKYLFGGETKFPPWMVRNPPNFDLVKNDAQFLRLMKDPHFQLLVIMAGKLRR